MTEETTLPPADDGVTVTTETTTEATLETAAPLASASEDGHEQTTESELSKAQKAINKKHWQAEEAKRETATVQAELDALKSSQSAGPDVAPVVPDMPDYLALTEAEFRAQMLERDAALTKNAEYTAGQKFQASQAERQTEDARLTQQVEADKFRQTYASRATELGLDAQEVLTATGDIYTYGVSDVVAGMLTDTSPDADGPLLALYLRQNPIELQNLQSMPLHKQAEHMATVIRQGAASLKPKMSNAPPPPTDVTGGGSLNKVDPLLEGVTISVY